MAASWKHHWLEGWGGTLEPPRLGALYVAPARQILATRTARQPPRLTVLPDVLPDDDLPADLSWLLRRRRLRELELLILTEEL